MKRRAAAKGKSMYVIFGLLAILLGSLAYLALQKGSREGLEENEKKGKADVMKSMESIMKDMGIDSAEIMKGMEGLKHNKEGFEEGLGPRRQRGPHRTTLAPPAPPAPPATFGSIFRNLKFNKQAKQ